MPSLLDFLSNAGGQGMLGNFGGGGPQDDEEKQRVAALWRNAILGASGPQRDPFNFPNATPPQPPAGYMPPPGMAAQQQQPAMAPTQAAAAPPAQDIPPAAEAPPPGAMPVSLPLGAPATAAPPGVRQQGFGDVLNNNGALLMALGGGIAQHGMGGFLDAAKIAAANQPKWGVIGTDALGNQKYGWINPLNQTITPAKPSATGGVVGGGPAALDLQPNYNAEGKDEAFLAALRKEEPLLAEDMLRVTKGQMPATGRNLQKVMQLAARYDQGFTGAQDYATRLQTAKSFAGGKDAEVVKSYNQALIHANKAWDLIPKIEGFNIGGPIGGMINAPYTAGRAATNPQFASDRMEYSKIIDALAGELRKASTGSGHGSLQEINSWKSGAQAANSGAEMRGSLRGATDFLEGAMEASARKKSEGMKSQFSGASLLDPKNLETFHAIQSSSEGTPQTAAAPAAAPAAPAAAPPASRAPAVGQVQKGYRFKGGNPADKNNWEKVQ